MSIPAAVTPLDVRKSGTPPPPNGTGEPRPRGRHRSVQAESAILRATLDLLEHQPLRRVTVDAIAQHAGVSKATIYKWWPNKSLVALDAYLAGMTEQVTLPNTGSAELDFIEQLKSVMAFYRSPLGRLFSQFLAEGQSDPAFLALFRERFLFVRRETARIMWKRGVERGEIRPDVDSEMMLDLIYGPMIFRLLAGHGSLSDEESEKLVRTVFNGVRDTKIGRPKVSGNGHSPGGNDALNPEGTQDRLNTEPIV